MSKKPALEMLDEMEDAKFIVGGMVVGTRKKVIALVYSMELTSLQKFGPKQMKKYWKRVEDLPRKERGAVAHLVDLLEFHPSLLRKNLNKLT